MKLRKEVSVFKEGVLAKIEETANKIFLLVTSGSSSSSITLTDKAIEAITNQFTVKDSTGSATVIEGGKVKANSIPIGDVKNLEATLNSKTSNTGTVTSVATGAGLTGGDITSTGTIKAKLKSETASTLDSAAMGSTASRQYAVGIDKSGYLSVNVPWSDTNTNTWRGIQNNLTSDSTSDSLAAAQGKALKALIDAKVAKAVKVVTSSFSSLPQTISNSAITASMECVNAVLSNPSAQTGDWTVTTAAGKLTISGTISGSTTVTMYLFEV